jgi:hypothetical protein
MKSTNVSLGCHWVFMMLALDIIFFLENKQTKNCISLSYHPLFAPNASVLINNEVMNVV